jgi:hypothetical protein
MPVHGYASRDTLHAMQAIQEATHRPPSASEGKTPSSRGSSAGGRDGGVRLRPVSAARRGGGVAEAEAAMVKVHGCYVKCDVTLCVFDDILFTSQVAGRSNHAFNAARSVGRPQRSSSSPPPPRPPAARGFRAVRSILSSAGGAAGHVRPRSPSCAS